MEYLQQENQLIKVTSFCNRRVISTNFRLAVNATQGGGGNQQINIRRMAGSGLEGRIAFPKGPRILKLFLPFSSNRSISVVQ